MSDRRQRWAAGPLALLTVFFLAVAPAAFAVVPATDFGASGEAPFIPVRAQAPQGPTDILNVDTALSYSTIQDAIDAAATSAGDTLEVTVANHIEGQVAITKSITLRGQTGSEIVTAGVDTGTSGDARGWFVVMSGVTVNVHDLTFDGTGHLIFQGWRINSGAAATFDTCAFQNMQYHAEGPEYAGTEIATVVDITVNNCTFSSYGRVGILFFGAGVTAGDAGHCSFTGKGAGDHFDYGVEVGAGATATVHDSFFTNNGGVVDPTDESVGVNINTVYGPGTNATVRSNYFTNNHGAVTVGYDTDDTSVATIEYNRIVGNAEGVDDRSSPGAVISENNWWGCNAGPNQTGCDSSVGFEDSDPWLILRISANPTTLPPFGMSAISSDLVMNSDAVNTSGGGTIPENTPATFGATLGTVNPINDATYAGQLATTFTAGGTSGTANVSCTVDNQTVNTAIEILEGKTPGIPMAGPLATGLLLLLVAGAGLWLLRR